MVRVFDATACEILLVAEADIVFSTKRVAAEKDEFHILYRRN